MNSTNTIAVLVPYNFIPVANGGHRVCFDLCEFLGRQSNVHCITINDTQCVDGVNFQLVNIFPASLRKYFDPKSAYLLYKYIKKHNITTCIVNHPFQGLLAYVVCRLAGTHFIVYSHNIEHLRFRSLKKWWSPSIYYLEKLIYKLGKLVFFISESEKETAIKLFRLPPERCHFLPHLISTPTAPPRLSNNEVFTILFFADYTYEPNRVALNNILVEIKPILDRKEEFPYSLIICGKGLSDSYIGQYIKEERNLQYLGFVPEPDNQLLKANVFLNPVSTGGGVQTKAIQALAAGVTVISSESGVAGIPLDTCGSKLIAVPDFDWQGYADHIFSLRQTNAHFAETPQSFYDVYYWENVITRVNEAISQL